MLRIPHSYLWLLQTQLKHNTWKKSGLYLGDLVKSGGFGVLRDEVLRTLSWKFSDQTWKKKKPLCPYHVCVIKKKTALKIVQWKLVTERASRLQ